eukprot:COSAG02_NODE_1342_length_13169_cov_11.075905_6_plen_886_part_00
MEPEPEPEAIAAVEATMAVAQQPSGVAEMLEGVEDLTTVWIGGIPEQHPAMDVHVLEEFFDRVYGAVDSLNLRVKAGTDRSWCLVSFADEASVNKLLEEGVDLGDAVGGEPEASCRVLVNRADILTHLRKPNPGALASVWEKMENKKRDMKQNRAQAPCRPSYYDLPEFQKCVDKFWALLQAEDAKFSKQATTGQESIKYANYESLHLRISKTLHTHFSRTISRKVASQDWAHDTANSTMTRAEFEKSLGELGELWAGEVIGGEDDSDVWKSMDPGTVMVRFLSVLYDNCTEVQVDSEQQKKTLLKKRLLQVRFLNLKGLSDKMGDAGGKELGNDVDIKTKTRTSSRASPAGSNQNAQGASNPDGQAAARHDSHGIHGATPSPSLSEARKSLMDASGSCGCGPGAFKEYHYCERCTQRTEMADKRQADERKQREIQRHIRATGDPGIVAEAMHAGDGLDAQISTVSVGERLAELSWERSCSDLAAPFAFGGSVPSDCHKQGGVVRSGGISKPGALAGVAPHAPGTTPLDDPLMLGSISQEDIGAEWNGTASAAEVESTTSMASLATGGSVTSVTSVASAVLPCAHPQLHGRNAREMQPLEVLAGGPNLRPIPPMNPKQHQSLGSGSGPKQHSLRSKISDALGPGGSVAGSKGTGLMVGLMRKSHLQQSLTRLESLTLDVVNKHNIESGWLPPYGIVQPKPRTPKRPYTPKIGAGVVASRTSLARLSTPRVAAQNAAHGPLPTLKASLSEQRPPQTREIGASFSGHGPTAAAGGAHSDRGCGLRLPTRPIPGPTRRYITSTADIHASVSHGVHRRLCPPGQLVAATVRDATGAPSWNRSSRRRDAAADTKVVGGTARWWSAGGTITDDRPALNPPPFLMSLRGSQF